MLKSKKNITMKRKANSLKKNYRKPLVEKVKIDNGITMVMQSLPPGDPGTKIGNPLK